MKRIHLLLGSVLIGAISITNPENVLLADISIRDFIMDLFFIFALFTWIASVLSPRYSYYDMCFGYHPEAVGASFGSQAEMSMKEWLWIAF